MYSAKCPVCHRRNCRVKHRVKKLARRRSSGGSRRSRPDWGAILSSTPNRTQQDAQGDAQTDTQVSE